MFFIGGDRGGAVVFSMQGFNGFEGLVRTLECALSFLGLRDEGFRFLSGLGFQALPIGSIVVPFCGSIFLESYNYITPHKGTTMEPMGSSPYGVVP